MREESQQRLHQPLRIVMAGTVVSTIGMSVYLIESGSTYGYFGFVVLALLAMVLAAASNHN